MKKFTFILLSIILNSSIFADDVETKLIQRCHDTFLIMENEDIDALLKEMPGTASEDEVKHTKKYLNNKHNKWFIKSGGIISITNKGVSHEKPSEYMIKKYGTTEIIKIKLHVLSKNRDASPACSYIKIDTIWYLKGLP